ncbi:MAG: hypothetical protein KDB53_17690, partial [Planctomycetes bacterium]|nr:hypothetical protein [Planctomycetota bacterium]
RSINLNGDYGQPGLVVVASSKALSQPTDVQSWPGANAPNGISKVIITAYHSGKFAIFEPDQTQAGGWAIHRVALPAPYSIKVPRGLATSFRAADPSSPGTPGLVFVANRLDNSVSIINPHLRALVGGFALQHDPTPQVIRVGRRFLYDANQTSGTGRFDHGMPGAGGQRGSVSLQARRGCREGVQVRHHRDTPTGLARRRYDDRHQSGGALEPFGKHG